MCIWPQISQDVKYKPSPNGTDQVTAEEVKSTVMEEMEEAEEKKKRACNLVIYNVPESDSKEPVDRMVADTKWCLGMFEKCLGVKGVEVELDKIIRLGKRTEGWQNMPRPVLVRLKSKKMKWEILTNAKKLKNAENQIMRKVGITKVMTKNEREDSMRLRMELKEKHEKGERGWMIKYGKLVREDGVKKKMYK